MEDRGGRGRGQGRGRGRGRGQGRGKDRSRGEDGGQGEEHRWQPTGPVSCSVEYQPSASQDRACTPSSSSSSQKEKRRSRPKLLTPGFPGEQTAEVETQQPNLSNFSQLSITSSCSSGENFEPASRPDQGGTNGYRMIHLIANHFIVNYDPSKKIFQYDVDMTLKSQKISQPEAQTISRADADEIKNRLFAENRTAFKKAVPVYDGKRKLYCLLPSLDGEFFVKLDNGEVKEYRVVLKFIKKLDGHGLAEFLNRDPERHLSFDWDLLQAMSLVVREHPSKNRIIIGRSLYDKARGRHKLLGGGAVAANGFSSSLRATKQGLSLNVDFSVMVFHQSIPVLDYLWERCRVDCQKNWGLNKKQRKEAECALRGLKVSVIHRKTKQKFAVRGLTKKTTRQLKFKIGEEGRREEIELVDYFRQRYNWEIEFMELPCLDVSKDPERPNYIPMEMCEICAGQRFSMDDLNSYQFKELRNVAFPTVQDRLRKIKDIVKQPDGPSGGSVLGSYHMSVHPEMTRVPGRVIEPPKLMLGNSRQITPRSVDRQWNLQDNHVFDPKPIDRWGIVSFLNNPKDNEQINTAENFCWAMVARFQELGIKMAETPTVFESKSITMLENVPQLRKSLLAIHKKSKGQLQILICIMGAKHSGYNSLKLICETEIGLLTQCCYFEYVQRFKEPIFFSRYLANLALKINAKVGGSNVALAQTLSNQLPRFGNSHVVYFGADVNHPGQRNEKSPSIAAVVMSINWPYSTRYMVRMRCQESRQEHIIDLGEMCKELLALYLKENLKLPERVVFFRDGVSEGQFNMVLNKELKDLKRAFSELEQGYNPSVSFIVAQKRHHTRLFPEGEKGNVPPGTVVDTLIVHPREFDFYLCSHYARWGTSKPTHYHVLWNENGFSSDELQRLINDLCYTYSRCTMPISLVPPVYYADLAAYKGRLYVEALGSSQSSSSSFTFPKINPRIENEMFI